MTRGVALATSWLSAFLALAAAGCRPSDRREARDFERMRRQQRYDLYDTSAFFANGATMQAPPAHTIARDATLAARGETASPAYLTGRTGSVYASEIPMAVSDSTVAIGARHFTISCAPCHGDGGFGGGPIAPNLRVKRPPSLRTPPASSLPPGLMFSVITDGVGAMPPYGWQLAPAARWAVVAHVQSLASRPTTTAMRRDSSMAAYLRQLDSLHATHASLAAIVAFRQAHRD